MAEKLTLGEVASKLNMTPEQIKKMVQSGKLAAEGSGDNLLFDQSALPSVNDKDHVISLDDKISPDDVEDFTLKLHDEGQDTDLTAAITPPPMPAAAPLEGQPADSNVFGDDTVDLMDTAGGTGTIELTDDSIADADSLMGGDTLAGTDTLGDMGTDTLMAQDSLASTEGQETFLGADILEGLSGDTTAEITSEVRTEMPSMQYVAVTDEKSPGTSFMLVISVIFMIISLIVFVNGMTTEDDFTHNAIFKITAGMMDLKK